MGENKRIKGLGVAGLAVAYLLSVNGVRSTGFEALGKEEWTRRFRRPTLLRPDHLVLLRLHAHALYELVAKYVTPVHRVHKLVLNKKLNVAYERAIVSRDPLYYLVDVEALAHGMLDRAELLEARWGQVVGEADVDASGGSVWGNIRWYARRTGCSGVTVWYLPETVPASYMFEAPVPGKSYCLRALILFDEDTGLSVNIVHRLLGGMPEYEGVTGYATPRLAENNVYTVGERGGWIDPLRGYSFAYALLSAKAAVEAMLAGRPPKWLEHVREELVNAAKKKGKVKNLSLNQVIEMLETGVIRITERI